VAYDTLSFNRSAQSAPTFPHPQDPPRPPQDHPKTLQDPTKTTQRPLQLPHHKLSRPPWEPGYTFSICFFMICINRLRGRQGEVALIGPCSLGPGTPGTPPRDLPGASSHPPRHTCVRSKQKT